MLGFNPNFLYKIGFNLQNRFGGSNPKRKTSAEWVFTKSKMEVNNMTKKDNQLLEDRVSKAIADRFAKMLEDPERNIKPIYEAVLVSSRTSSGETTFTLHGDAYILLAMTAAQAIKIMHLMEEKSKKGEAGDICENFIETVREMYQGADH